MCSVHLSLLFTTVICFRRFDESGKGKGLEGRDSLAKGAGMTAGSVGGLTGYVQGYKHEGTYGKKK